MSNDAFKYTIIVIINVCEVKWLQWTQQHPSEAELGIRETVSETEQRQLIVVVIIFVFCNLNLPFQPSTLEFPGVP